MAEEVINKNPWVSAELADCLGIVTNDVAPSMKSASMIQKLQTHVKKGALTVRPGYTLKYALPSDSAISNTLSPVTIAIARPGVITKASHGLNNGDTVVFSTTGALPTG